MKKLLSMFLLLGFLTSAFAASVDSRRQELLSIIDEELTEIVRLNKQTGARDPNLMLRMAELWLEKARVVKEEENSKYLSIPAKKRSRVNKRKYFAKSRGYFAQAQKICLTILKKHKNFSGKADVYYILAYNSKEFNKEKESKKFLQLAVRNSSKNSVTARKSRLALAEIYYNKGQFEKALPLYREALSAPGARDKWWTKDSYNMAWCYYRVGQSSKAISIMKDVISKSKSAAFIDMSNQANRDLALFYAETGKVSSAISYYKRSGGNINNKMLNLGIYLESQSKYSTAEKVFEDIKKNDPTPEIRNRVNVKLLSLYERSGKRSKHIIAVEELVAAHKRKELDRTQQEALAYHIKRSGAIVQKNVVGNLYAKVPKTRRKNADIAVRYFAALALVTPKKAPESYYLSAETLYAVQKYDDAIKYYELAKSEALKTGNRKIAKKANEGMIASLGKPGVSKATKAAFMAKALEGFLTTNPRSKKSFQVYQQLFASYMEAQDLPKAESVLLRFKKNYPKSIGKHEAMLAEIMDYYKKKGDREGIRRWVSKIQKGEIRVSKKYAKQINLFLLTMQFEGVQKAENDGDRVKALRIYLEVYKSPESSAEAKKKAAYNMATYFYQLGDAERSYKWMDRAISHMSSSDVIQFQNSILVTARDLFLQRRTEYSADINAKAFSKLCSVKAKNKELFFSNAVIMYLADDRVKNATSVVNRGSACKVSRKTILNAKLELLDAYYHLKRWSSYQKLITELNGVNSLQPKVAIHFVRLIDVYKGSGRHTIANKLQKDIIRTYNRSSYKKDFPVEVLDIVSVPKTDRLQIMATNIKRTKLRFPQARYNKTLQTKFVQLNKLTDETVKVFSLKSAKGMVKAYRIMVTAYEDFAKEVRAFTPPNKPEKYVTAFKRDMYSITTPILNKANAMRKEAISKIKKHNVMSPDNSFFLSLGEDNLTEFYPLRGPVLMDRGGRR